MPSSCGRAGWTLYTRVRPTLTSSSRERVKFGEPIQNQFKQLPSLHYNRAETGGGHFTANCKSAAVVRDGLRLSALVSGMKFHG
jgi:hypothetical protein